MKLFDIVLKLTGPIDPVGDTHADNERFENLQQLLELMRQLHLVVDDIATKNKDRHEFSMARAGNACDEYLSQFCIKDDLKHEH